MFKRIAILFILAPALFGQDIYVGPYEAEALFDAIPDSCLDVIKSKRILFGSRSWGNAVRNRYDDLGANYLLNWPTRYGSAADIPNDVFDQPGVAHYRQDNLFPKRWRDFADLIRGRNGFKEFGPEIDMAFQFIYDHGDELWSKFIPTLDSLREEYPHIQFAVCTHHLAADSTEDMSWNVEGNRYSDSIMARFPGELPLYDIRSFASICPDGDTCTFQYQGKTYQNMCPEYATSDQIHMLDWHPMCKGVFVLWSEMFCEDCVTPVNRNGSAIPVRQGSVTIPNPVSGPFKISADIGIIDAALYDQSGARVASCRVKRNCLSFNDRALPDGVYLLLLNDGDITKRIIYLNP